MNIISIASNVVQLTANSKAALLITVLAFGMVCVYRMVTGGDWLAKVLGVLLLVTAVVVLGGCFSNPRAAAEYTERTNQSSIAVNQSAAQISQAQRDAEDARMAQERLQTLQAQQALVSGQAAIAQANAQVQINASNNAALVAVAAQMAEANKPDYTPFVLIILALATMIPAICLFMPRVKPTGKAAKPNLLPQPTYIQIPAAVQLHAGRLGGVAEWDGDKWIILDPDNGRLLATQRKQLTSNRG